MNLEELAAEKYPYPSRNVFPSEVAYLCAISEVNDKREAFLAGAKAKEEMDVELLREAYEAGRVYGCESGRGYGIEGMTFEQWLQQKKGGQKDA